VGRRDVLDAVVKRKISSPAGDRTLQMASQSGRLSFHPLLNEVNYKIVNFNVTC
jgi:hypothetical protein